MIHSAIPLPTEAPTALSVTIGIATTGRRAILQRTLEHMAALSDRPDRVIVSIAAPEDADADALAALPYPVLLVSGPKGSAAQRNTVLDHAGEAGVIYFLDDDFLIEDGAVSALRRLFSESLDVVMATGHVVADGLYGPGYDHAEGLRLLAAGTAAPATGGPRPVYSTNGCNMALRGAAIRAHPQRFDTTLPLYGWLEDLDFSRRMARHGRLVEDPRLRGVHLATKVGRTSGRRLGYSQIANPIYLMRKGTMAPHRAIRLMAGNVMANSVKSLRPEPWIDRRGRFAGNLRAFRDLVTGRLAPTRILEF
jgi:GT2 family glycosyltransferase